MLAVFAAPQTNHSFLGVNTLLTTAASHDSAAV
jgi:hypothetical protein